MISRIGARQYRCFEQLDIALPACAVLAGANGTGKSTLLDIPVYLGDIVGHGVFQATLGTLRSGARPRAQLPRELFYRGRGEDLSLLIEATLPPTLAEDLARIASKVGQLPPTLVRYELSLRLLEETQLVIVAERMDLVPAHAPAQAPPGVVQAAAAGWRSVIKRDLDKPPHIQAEYRRGQLPAVDLSPDQLGLALLTDASLFPAAVWFKGLLTTGATYAPDGEALRSAQPKAPSGLRSDAANLPWQVLHLQRTDAERFAEWQGLVQLALPNLRDIQAVEREEDRHAYLKLTYRYGDAQDACYTVTSSGLSDGTLRILALTILPYLDRLPPLLLVEQPEDGIHPRAIDVVMESLSGLSATQVLLTTHSPVVLSRTPLQQVVCLRRNESGSAEAISGPAHPRLQAWQQELDLGTLFAAGVLS